MDPTTTLACEQWIEAAPHQVYHAFTNSTALREWLCNGSTTAPHPGGRILLWWNGGDYLAGEFSALEPERSLSMQWLGRGEMVLTQVSVSLADRLGGTLVSISQSGPGAGIDWREALENLASVLETGRDLRLVRRPLLGIAPSDFNAHIARSLGVPVTYGMRLDGVMEGMGAHLAGLRKEDVIIEIDGQKIENYTTLPQVIHHCKAGDTLEVVYYRGPEKHITHMTLSARPLPEVPEDPVLLAQVFERNLKEGLAELESLLENVTEEEASFHPAEGEWNVKEVLAHLILSERFWQEAIVDAWGGNVPWTDDWGGNFTQVNRAVIAAYPSLAELQDALKKAEVETAALIRTTPTGFLARKSSYWQLGITLLQTMTHTRTHLDQVQSALAAARNQQD